MAGIILVEGALHGDEGGTGYFSPAFFCVYVRGCGNYRWDQDIKGS